MGFAYDTWGNSWGPSWNASWGNPSPSPSPAPAPAPAPSPQPIGGGHYLPHAHYAHKRTLSNIQIIYNKAKTLPRKETKQLRTIISDFVEPEIARKAELPAITKIDYAALEANQIAYEKFVTAIDNIQNKIVLAEKQQQEDDELLLMTILACELH